MTADRLNPEYAAKSHTHPATRNTSLSPTAASNVTINNSQFYESGSGLKSFYVSAKCSVAISANTQRQLFTIPWRLTTVVASASNAVVDVAGSGAVSVRPIGNCAANTTFYVKGVGM